MAKNDVYKNYIKPIKVLSNSLNNLYSINAYARCNYLHK